MHINGWTLALQTLNVLILVWLLGRFLFQPVADAIAARQAAADSLLADTQRAKDEAIAETAALKARNADLAADAANRMAAMQAAVEAERGRLMTGAKQEADALAEQVRVAARADDVRAKAGLERQAGLLAVDIAAKLLRRVRPADSDERMLHALLARIGALAGDDRRALATDPALTLVTPDALDEAARARFLGQLGDVLPGIGAPAFAVDPSLIAGCELQGTHVRVRNSWRADLASVSATLLEDGRVG